MYEYLGIEDGSYKVFTPSGGSFLRRGRFTNLPFTAFRYEGNSF